MKTTTTGWNWITVLKRIIKSKKQPPQELRDEMYSRSHRWTTCACGQLCAKLPRNRLTGQPNDPFLFAHGLYFHEMISRRKWRAALKTLHQIEKRTAFLLSK